MENASLYPFDMTNAECFNMACLFYPEPGFFIKCPNLNKSAQNFPNCYSRHFLHKNNCAASTTNSKVYERKAANAFHANLPQQNKLPYYVKNWKMKRQKM